MLINDAQADDPRALRAFTAADLIVICRQDARQELDADLREQITTWVMDSRPPHFLIEQLVTTTYFLAYRIKPRRKSVDPGGIDWDMVSDWVLDRIKRQARRHDYQLSRARSFLHLQTIMRRADGSLYISLNPLPFYRMVQQLVRQGLLAMTRPSDEDPALIAAETLNWQALECSAAFTAVSGLEDAAIRHLGGLIQRSLDNVLHGVAFGQSMPPVVVVMVVQQE